MTLALAYDIDAIAERAQLLPKNWQMRLPDNCYALHLDHRLPGAQGQPQGDQGLGRPGEAGSRGRHPQPEDLRRRALGLPGGLGLCAEDAGRQRRQGPGLRRASSTRTCPVLDSGARGSTTTFAQRGIGDVLLAWENEALSGAEGIRAGQVRDRRARRSRSWPSRRWRWWTRSSTSKARARSPRPTNILYSPKAQEIAARTTTGRGPRPRPSIRRPIPAGQAVHHRRDLRRLDEGAGRPTSPTAACSTRSTSPMQ